MKYIRSLYNFRTLIVGLLGIRLIGCALHVFAPITMPHTWRQVDTMGVALRYALRWTTERSDIAWWIPAVLNSGDTKGIMSMEFPFVNILGSMGFLIARENIDLGRSLAQAILLGFNLIIGYLNYRQWKKIDLKQASFFSVAMIGGGFLSFSTPFAAKFMPDLTSILLAYLGVAGIWQKKWWGVLPLALATLIKPTSGVACLVLLFAEPLSLHFLASSAIKIFIAAIPPAIWYLKIIPQVMTMQELPSFFNLHSNHHPIGRLVEFWGTFGVLEVLDFHGVFMFGGLFLVVGLFLSFKTKAMFKKLLLCLTVLGCQASVIGAMSGSHAELHSYYLMALSPIVILMLYLIWNLDQRTWLHQTWCFLLGLGLFIKTGEAVISDLYGFVDERQGFAWFSECKALRQRNPDFPWHKNQIWRTPIEQFPLLDLCLGERGQSQTSEFGLYRKENPIPAGCSIVDSTQRLNLFRCIR